MEVKQAARPMVHKHSLFNELELPHTKIRIIIPAYHVKTALPKENFGYGLKPDVEILPNGHATTDNVL
jgi:hypothetical protein